MLSCYPLEKPEGTVRSTGKQEAPPAGQPEVKVVPSQPCVGWGGWAFGWAPGTVRSIKGVGRSPSLPCTEPILSCNGTLPTLSVDLPRPPGHLHTLQGRHRPLFRDKGMGCQVTRELTTCPFASIS